MDQVKYKDGLGIDIIGFEYLPLVHVHDIYNIGR